MMLKRELLRLGLCAAAGLVIGLLCAGLKAMVPCAFYAVGLFYGICPPCWARSRPSPTRASCPSCSKIPSVSWSWPCSACWW